MDGICDSFLAEQKHRGINNSAIIKFENSGHGLFKEELDKFNAELEKFVKK